VFEVWPHEVLRLANLINDPAAKVVLLAGPEGCGKTALARATVELMGGGAEQLLWYEALPQANASTLLHFWVVALANLACQLLNQPNPLPSQLQTWVNSPHAHSPPLTAQQGLGYLLPLLKQLPQLPLLLVVDATQRLVSGSGRFVSAELEAMVSGLLTLPNVKLMLVGEALPMVSLEPHWAKCATLPMPYLNEAAITHLLRTPEGQAKRLVLDEELTQHVVLRLQGAPWLVSLTRQLALYSTVNLPAFKAVLAEAPLTDLATAESLTTFLWPRLSAQERAELALLATVRHPLPAGVLSHLAQGLQVAFGGAADGGKLPAQHNNLARMLAKAHLPPQWVLHALQQAMAYPNHPLPTLEPWLSLYQPVCRAVYEQLNPALKAQTHALLAEFYDRPAVFDATHSVALTSTPAYLANELAYHSDGGQPANELTLPTLLEPLPTLASPLWPNTLPAPVLPAPPPKLEEPTLPVPSSVQASHNSLLPQLARETLPTVSPPSSTQAAELQEATLAWLSDTAHPEETLPPVTSVLPALNKVEPVSPSVSPTSTSVTGQWQAQAEAGQWGSLAKNAALLAFLKEKAPYNTLPLGQQVLLNWLAAGVALQQKQLAKAQVHVAMAQQALKAQPSWGLVSGETSVAVRVGLALLAAQVAPTPEATQVALQPALALLQADPQQVPLAQQASLWFTLAQRHEDAGQYSQAEAAYLACLKADEASGQIASKAATLANLGRVLLAQGQPTQGLAYYEQAILADRAADQPEQALATLNALVQWCQHQPHSALGQAAFHYAEQLWQLAQQVSHPWWQAQGLLHLAQLAVKVKGDAPLALRYYQALQRHRAWPKLAYKQQQQVIDEVNALMAQQLTERV
jgi:tetratricopeptide (TPR) repeat protein